MRLSLRLILFLVAGTTLVTFVVARNQVRSEKRGLRADLERRASILGESLQEIVEPALDSGSHQQLRRVVDQFGNRERLEGVAVYGDGGQVLAESSTLPSQLAPPPPPIDRIQSDNKPISEFLNINGKAVEAYYLPLHNGSKLSGVLAIFHDASYVEGQSERIWRDTIWHVIVEVLLVVFITTLIIRWS